MQDYQLLVDKMQAILADIADPDVDEARSLNSVFLSAVKETNDRLRDCANLLKKGLKSEAIQKCDTDPNLLDTVAILDFMEWNEWAVLAFEQGFPSADDLFLDIAAELNEAYATIKPMEKLLENQRMLALARAPLPLRLKVLRKIYNIDADNKIWEDDLQALEKERFSQIKRELIQAKNETHLEKVADLEHELRISDWMNMPPKNLAETAIRLHDKMRVESAIAEMEELESKLHEAFEEMDHTQGSQLRDRWLALNRIAELNGSSELMKRVAPALEWITENDRQIQQAEAHDRAVRNLEQALDAGKSRQKLEQLYHAATKNELSLPSPLQQRFDDYLHYLDSRSRRKHIVIVASSVVSIFLLAAIVWYSLRERQRSIEIASHAENILALVGEERLKEASSYEERLSQQEWLWNSSKIQSAIQQLNAAREKDRQRKTLLDEMLENARMGTIDSSSWESIEKSEKFLAQAQPLTKSDGEKTMVAQVATVVKTTRQKLQKSVDDKFTKDLDSILKRMKETPKNNLKGWRQISDGFWKLKGRKHVSSILKTPLPSLEIAIAQKQTSAGQIRKLTQALDEITRQVGNVNEYRKALNRYIALDPQTGRAGDFKKVSSQELSLVDGLEEWNLYKKNWIAINFESLTPQKARKLVTRIDSVQKSSSPIAVPTELAPLIPSLKAIARRKDGKGSSLVRKVLQLLDDPSISDLNLVKMSDGPWYYIKGDPKPVANNWKISVYNNPNMTLTSEKKVPIVQVVNREKKDGKGIDWLSPQSKFASKAKADFQNNSEKDWERTFVGVLTVLHADKEMDPIMKTILFQKILNAGTKGSDVLESVFKDDRKQLQGFSIDPTLNWFDSSDARAKKERRNAKSLLKRISSPKTKRRKIETLLEEQQSLVLKAPGETYRWVGFLVRDENRNVKIRMGRTVRLPKDAELYILSVKNGGNLARLEKIAQVKGAKPLGEYPVVRVTSPYTVVEGRPVFVASPTK